MDAPSGPDLGPFTFQVHLYPSGDIEFHYLETDVGDPLGDYGALASVGFQDTTGGTYATNNNTIGCDEPAILPDDAIGITLCGDPDGDGWLDPACGYDDCDETDANINPGMAEVCNGLDDDCDPLTDETVDFDCDDLSACAGDCDDGDDTTYTGAPELCDGLDNDCDAVIDNAPDGDGDGIGPCDGDCDDSDIDVFPGADELCNGLDDDCDGLTYGDVNVGTDEPTSGVQWPSNYNRVWGLVYSPDEDRSIDGFEMYFNKGYTGTHNVIYAVWVGDEADGPFELLDYQTVGVAYSALGPQWRYGGVEATLQAGQHYVLGLFTANTWIGMLYDEDELPVSIEDGELGTSWMTGESNTTWGTLTGNEADNYAFGLRIDFASEDGHRLRRRSPRRRGRRRRRRPGRVRGRLRRHRRPDLPGRRRGLRRRGQQLRRRAPHRRSGCGRRRFHRLPGRLRRRGPRRRAQRAGEHQRALPRRDRQRLRRRARHPGGRLRRLLGHRRHRRAGAERRRLFVRGGRRRGWRHAVGRPAAGVRVRAPPAQG